MKVTPIVVMFPCLAYLLSILHHIVSFKNLTYSKCLLYMYIPSHNKLILYDYYTFLEQNTVFVLKSVLKLSSIKLLLYSDSHSHNKFKNS